MALKCSLLPQITNKESMGMDKKRRVVSCVVNDGTPSCKITSAPSGKCDGFTSARGFSSTNSHSGATLQAGSRTQSGYFVQLLVSNSLTVFDVSGEEIRVKQDKSGENFF